MAVDIFIKIDGIEGESQDAKHPKEIQVISWDWGAHQTGTMATGGGGGAGKVEFHHLNFTHFVDKASTKLGLACWSGEHIKSLVLIARKAGTEQQEFLKITLSDLLIADVNQSSSGEMPVESVSINFSKAEYEYRAQKADGTLDAAVKVGWNLKENKKV